MCRLRGARVSGEWEQLALQCLLAFVSASHYAQGFMQSRDQEHNGLLVSSLCYSATLPTSNPDSCYAACYRLQHADFIACIGNQLAVWLDVVCQLCYTNLTTLLQPPSMHGVHL